MNELEKQVEILYPEGQHCITVLLLDTSGSMEGIKIDMLNKALDRFKHDLENNEETRKYVDLAVITFDNYVNVIHNFSPINEFRVEKLKASGTTKMGEAFDKAIDLVEQRNKLYKDKGISRFRPWIFIITDGEPTDMEPGNTAWNNVIQRLRDGELNKHFSLYVVAVDPANLDILKQIAHPLRPPLSLEGAKFAELFVWLSSSMGDMLGGQEFLPPIGWKKAEK